MAERARWRKIRRADGYKVSSLGQLRGPRGPLTPWADPDGYLRVSIRDEQLLVHLIVLEVFHGPRPYGCEGLHGPGGSQDNRASVLRWGTHRENEADKRANRRAELNGGTRPSVSGASGTGELR